MDLILQWANTLWIIVLTVMILKNTLAIAELNQRTHKNLCDLWEAIGATSRSLNESIEKTIETFSRRL